MAPFLILLINEKYVYKDIDPSYIIMICIAIEMTVITIITIDMAHSIVTGRPRNPPMNGSMMQLLYNNDINTRI